MLILVLINVNNLQNVVFSFEKCLNCQKHSSSDSNHSVKNLPSSKTTPALVLFGKPCFFKTTYFTKLSLFMGKF